MKKIYIVRHGETDYNKRKVLQGSSIDASLNEKGQNQSDDFYQKYKAIKFDIILTSKLKRSIESVHKFIKKGVEHKSFGELNEINWGKFDGSNYFENEEYFNLLQKNGRQVKQV